MMDSNKLNEKSELKTFIANIRSGNLVRLIEANQLQFEEKCAYLNAKLKQSEEEMQKKISILQENSHLIEKFQIKLQELSDQNTELLNQQQVMKEENVNLNAQLQCSGYNFSQLDILYDQKVFDLTEKNKELSERNKELEQKLEELHNTQEQHIDQFDKTQRDFNAKLTQIEQCNTKLKNELNCLEQRKNIESEELKNKLSQLSDVLNQKTIDYEERIHDLQASLSSALDQNKEIYDLENQIEQLQIERKADQKAFEKEKSQTNASIEELKATIEELKKKLITKEKEVEDVYLKFKQITRLSASSPLKNSGQFLIQKHNSTDDPKPFDESSDSDGSSISFYKSKHRRISTDHEDEMDISDKLPKSHFRSPSFGFKRKVSKTAFEHVEIPESPIVSSSAFSNTDQKF